MSARRTAELPTTVHAITSVRWLAPSLSPAPRASRTIPASRARFPRTESIAPDPRTDPALPAVALKRLRDGVNGALCRLDDRLRLGLGETERRREAEDVALRHGARDNAALETGGGDLRPDL